MPAGRYLFIPFLRTNIQIVRQKNVKDERSDERLVAPKIALKDQQD